MLCARYLWIKTPGESDGCSAILPDGTPCPRFDSQCGAADALGSAAGEPPAPEAGLWYDYQVLQLAENAALNYGAEGSTREGHLVPFCLH